MLGLHHELTILLWNLYFSIYTYCFPGHLPVRSRTSRLQCLRIVYINIISF